MQATTQAKLVSSAVEQERATRLLTIASTLVDHFDPMTFGAELVTDDQRAKALATLSAQCEEVEHRGSYHWMLKPDARRDLLKLHFSDDEFQTVRARIKPESSDQFGHYLSEGLDGADLTTETPEFKHASALQRAVRLVDMLGVSHGQSEAGKQESGAASQPSDSRIVRQNIARAASRIALDNTAGGDLYGRYREWRALIHYRNLELQDVPKGPLRLFVIIGVGGVGKSALVSRYIIWQRKRYSNPPIAHLDFDRASLTPDDPLALTFEFTRQLGTFVPELDLELSGFRHSQRERMVEDRLEKIPHTESFAALSALRDILREWRRRTEAVTVVIDTFEEVAIRGGSAVRRTLDWLVALRDIVELTNLHVILVGREMPDALLADNNILIQNRIRLNDLHDGAAIGLLRSVGVSTEVAERAVDAFGGNPLVLRLFVRFADFNPEEVEVLLSDAQGEKRSAPTGKLAVIFLFERILVRISHDGIRKLASPGLLLRHITADLIRHVLAEPCELGELSDKQARDLFDSLATHVWLVRQEGDRLLSHRRDLRRLMLPGIKQDYPKEFAQINRRAVLYYESGPPGVSSSDAWIEAAYHRGFLPQNVAYRDAQEARQVITQLGADLHDWPAHASALIKHAAQLPEALSENELVSLSVHQGITARAVREHRLLSGNSTTNSRVDRRSHATRSGGAAAKSSSTSTDQATGHGRHGETVDNHDTQVADVAELRSAFQSGRFERVSERARVALEPLFCKRAALVATHYWNDPGLLERLPWLVALSVLAEPVSGLEAESIIPARSLDAVQATPRRVSMEGTFELFYMLALASLMNDDMAVRSLSSFLRSSLPCFSPPVSHASQLQVLQLSVKAISSGDLIGQRDVITVTNCDCLRIGSLPEAFSASHPETSRNSKRSAVVRSALENAAERRPSLQELQALLLVLRKLGIDVVGPVGLDMLHSRQPVLHDPVRFALQSVPPAVLGNILAELSTTSSFWPAELTPNETRTVRREGYSNAELITLVDTADRCNLLGTLLGMVSSAVDDPLIRDELRLFERLESRLTGTPLSG